MELNTNAITVDTWTGASVKYYGSWVTPKIRVATWNKDGAVTVQILDNDNPGAVYFSVTTDLHPSEVARQYAALLTLQVKGV